MDTNMEKPYVVGIDIGGTNTVFGVVDAKGNVIACDSIKTCAYEKADDYIDDVCKHLLPLIIAYDEGVAYEINRQTRLEF